MGKGKKNRRVGRYEGHGACGEERAPVRALWSQANPGLGGDPQDRLIGAVALVEGIELVTHDKQIRKSGMVPVIW